MINKLEKSRTAVTVTPSRTQHSEEAEAELLITPLSGLRPALPGYKLNK